MSHPGAVPLIATSLPILKSFNQEPPRDVPGGQVVKTSPSNAGGVGSIPSQGAEIPHSFQPKRKETKLQNIKIRSNIVTNAIKTLKMVHEK